MMMPTSLTQIVMRLRRVRETRPLSRPRCRTRRHATPPGRQVLKLLRDLQGDALAQQDAALQRDVGDGVVVTGNELATLQVIVEDRHAGQGIGPAGLAPALVLFQTTDPEIAGVLEAQMLQLLRADMWG